MNYFEHDTKRVPRGYGLPIDDHLQCRHTSFAALRGDNNEADPQEIEAHSYKLDNVEAHGMALAMVDLNHMQGEEAANSWMFVRLPHVTKSSKVMPLVGRFGSEKKAEAFRFND